MNQLLVRKLIGQEFNYSKLNEYFSDSDIIKGKKKLDSNFRKHINDWSIENNSQWVLRNYLATKMIMSATVMLTSLEYSIEKNVLVVEPYLVYYAILNSSRAVLFTNPTVDWNNGGIIDSTHSKIINTTCDAIGQFNKKVGETVKDIILRAKDYRELFSYKFPANGIYHFTVSFDEAVDICTFLVELAQFQSEILEQQNFKRSNVETAIDKSIIQKGYVYKSEKYEFLDDEDWYRLNYIHRKQPYPVSLYFTLTEGMVEDFFGAWYPKDDNIENRYNPDDNWNLIFSMP